MKKNILFIMLIATVFVYAGCSNSNKNEKTDDTKTVQTTTSTSNVIQHLSFENGVLTSPDYQLKITKTENRKVGDDELLAIWFSVKNKSDYKFTPNEILGKLELTQDTEESTGNNLAESESIDVFLSSDEKNNKEELEKSQDEEKNLLAEILPGETVESVIIIELKNDDYPVKINIWEDQYPMKNEEYVVEIK